MKMLIEKDLVLEDWYSIVRAEHDGREWFEPIPGTERSFQLMCSERLIPEASIEGYGYEMRHMAQCIMNGKNFDSAERCAMSHEADGIHFWRPRSNGDKHAVVSKEDAIQLAELIMMEIPVPDNSPAII